MCSILGLSDAKLRSLGVMEKAKLMGKKAKIVTEFWHEYIFFDAITLF